MGYFDSHLRRRGAPLRANIRSGAERGQHRSMHREDGGGLFRKSDLARPPAPQLVLGGGLRLDGPTDCPAGVVSGTDVRASPAHPVASYADIAAVERGEAPEVMIRPRVSRQNLNRASGELTNRG